MSLTLEHDLDSWGQDEPVSVSEVISFKSNCQILQTHKQPSERSTWTTEVVDKSFGKG